jgi:two-component system, chemotaxis family, sensor kinase CheA
MAIDISQFYQVFFEESKEHLDEFEQLLLKLNVENPDFEQLNAIFRAAHSIKGGSATFGFNDITAVTHVLENLLDRLRKKEMVLQTEMIDVFLQTADVIRLLIDSHRKGTPADAKVADKVTDKLFAFSVDSKLVSPASQTKPDEDFGFFDEVTPTKEEDGGFGLFEQLDKPDKSATTTIASEAKTDAKPIEAKVAETPAPETPAMDRRAGDRRTNERAESNSIRVDVAKVDQLINLVGELVITEAMLTQGLSNAPIALLQALSSSMAQLERNTRDLQDAVMSMRMMPIGSLFSRFPRMVRDITSKLKKEVELVTVGEETELDKGLIERIADPLTHLIRNSLDHGIESPKKRKAAGKPEKGKITLSAMHQGGSIVIEVADDGAGLDRERILKKAKERGINIPTHINDDALWNIICEPGFSTADAVTDVSGRGVGMDVVNRNISDMGGQVNLTSVPGQSCKISIQLPLTLAILDGMTVSMGDNLFVIPLNSIVETLQPKLENIKSVTGEGAMVHTRGEYLPIIAMHKAFNIETQVTDSTQGMLVIVEAHGKKAALLFDDLVGQQQVVIKSLETNFRKINGISGATILGDGTVALIVDIPTIIKLGQTTLGNQGLSNQGLTNQGASGLKANKQAISHKNSPADTLPETNSTT